MKDTILIPFLFGRPSQTAKVKRYFINNKNFVSDYLDEFTHFTNALVIVGPLSKAQKPYLDYFISNLCGPKKVYYFGDDKYPYMDVFTAEEIKEVLNG
jgi:hypothetical protein